ncbi:MAG: zinc ribbon domain-containing protein [Chloroflexi bacterium]|nr:zinc ribbon domain-containing protein [Chloroflexota bacterium]
MPLYDYRCEECHTVFELRRSMADVEKAAVCPACDSLLTTRLLSTVAVLGTGRSSEPPQPTSTHKTHRMGCPCCTPIRSQKVKNQGV